jgi:LCP family protein required for cell wall assembly
MVLALVLVIVVSAFVANRLTQATKRMMGSDLRHQQEIANNENEPQATDVPVVLPDTLREPFNVLLIGVDKRDEDEGSVRSDTLIVLHVDPQEHWAGMLSIPRDSVARIPHLGLQKINTAYTYGYMHAADLYSATTRPEDAGASLAAETVESFLGLPIHYIAQVDFKGFERIVDTLAGITIDVQHPLLDAEYPTEHFGYERIYIPAGLQVLDGRTALRYARSRHSGSDFDRSKRQQQVLRTLLEEVQRRELLDQVELFPKLVESVEQSILTTLPIDDLRVLHGLAKLAQNITPERMVLMSINPDNVRILREEGSDIYWDQEDIQHLVQQLLKGPSAQDEPARIQVQNGAGVPKLATRMTTALQTQGFIMDDASDAPRLYAETMLIDYTGHPDTLQELATLMNIEPHHVHTHTPNQPLNDSDIPDAPPNADIVIVLGEDYQQHWVQ